MFLEGREGLELLKVGFAKDLFHDTEISSPSLLEPRAHPVPWDTQK